MKEKGNSTKSNRNLGIAIILLVLLVILYYVLISSGSYLLELIGLVVTGFFLLGNIYYIIKNKSIMKKSKKMVKKVSGASTSKNPLEVYLISAIWNHQKITVGEGQIAASLLYEISEENISFADNQFVISSKIDLSSISESQMYLFETVFLDATSNQQNVESRLKKLEKMQQEKTLVPLVLIAENIKNNIRNKDRVHSLTITVRDKYFDAVENEFTALLTILSIGIAFLNLIEAITFMKVATLENFYIPVVLAFLLVFTITSKYRERVLLKKDKIEEITQVLNYIHFLSEKEIKASDKVYLCSLGLLSKEEREAMISLFQTD